MAVAPIGPLAGEPPYAEGAAQEIATTKDKKTKKKKKKEMQTQTTAYHLGWLWKKYNIL